MKVASIVLPVVIDMLRVVRVVVDVVDLISQALILSPSHPTLLGREGAGGLGSERGL
jgi:hypothetical protein